MRIVRLIRHGESLANAGAPTDDPYLIGLTECGYQQANLVADSFLEPPDLIIYSPMVRSFLTAKPTIEKFPGADVMQLEIEEFTYLDPQRCKGTTAVDRKAWVEAYWSKADVDYHDDGWEPWMQGKSRCESFFEFVQRVRLFVSRLSELDPYTRIAVFGHGQHLARARIEMMRPIVDLERDGICNLYVGKPGMDKIENDMKVFPSQLRAFHLGNAKSCYKAWNGEVWKNHTHQ